MAGKAAVLPSKGVAKEPKNGVRCLEIAEKGVKTSQDFSQFMSGLMTDLVKGNVTPSVGNAICNAGGKMLKVLEMQIRYGKPKRNGREETEKVLKLTD